MKEKKDLEKIVLCDVQKEIYPDLEKSLLDLLHNSGYPGIKFEKKIDFENLYKKNLIKKNFFLNFFLNILYDFLFLHHDGLIIFLKYNI